MDTSSRGLGRDFWLFRAGQLASVIGDACSTIALAWWILEKTGSPAQMSAVLAPAMFVQIALTPLAGPLGDRFSRKHLVALSDLWRFVFTAAIAAMVFLDVFHLATLIALYTALGFGSAVFNSVSTSIVPQLVPSGLLPRAMQQSQAITSIGGVVGGIAGGLIVTALGVGGAFALDGASFLLSAFAALAIRADTTPRSSAAPGGSPLAAWASQLSEGFRVLTRLRTLLGLSFVSMALNFVISPIASSCPCW